MNRGQIIEGMTIIRVVIATVNAVKKITSAKNMTR